MNMKLIGVIIFLAFYLFIGLEVWTKSSSHQETALFEFEPGTQKIISLKKI